MPDGEGQCKIFDVNLRQGFYTKEILCNSMKRCNILKINDEELVTVSRMFGYPGIDLQAVALRGVEIAAAHPNIAHDVFEGFFHCQVAERNPAPGDFQIGDLQHRSRSRSGFRSRFGGLFRGFGRRLHQRRDVVALGRQLGVQGESCRCGSVRTKSASEAVPSVRRASRCSVLPRSRMSAQRRPPTSPMSSHWRK